MQKRRIVREENQTSKLAKVIERVCLSLAVFFIVAFVAMVLLFAIIACSWFLPWWAAIPLGLLAGGVVILFTYMDNTTLMEMAIVSCFWVVFLSLLFPIFQRAKYNAERARAKQKITIMQSPMPNSLM